MIVWLIGLSGAGKTTSGRALYSEWKAEDPATVLVDGDEMRDVFKSTGEQSFTTEGRRKNAERIIEVCAWLDRQDINVVCCILCIFPDLLAANRQRFSKYFEVFVDAPMDQLIARDGKGLYGAAGGGETPNVVGMDIEFPKPANPDLILDNSGAALDAGAAAATIRNRLAIADG
jgi:adenylylsulfate kinase-like enzyme